MFKKILFSWLLILYPFIAQAGLFAYHDEKTQLWGYKDAQGKIVIPPQFSQVERDEVFSPKHKETEYLVPVEKKGTFYRITRSGNIKFESVYFDNGADYYEEGLARFIDPKTRKVGFHDRKGNIKIKAEYDFASPFQNGVANVCNGCHGEYPQMPTYAPISSSPYKHPLNQMYLDVVGGKWGMINTDGKIIVPLKYDSHEEALKHKNELREN